MTSGRRISLTSRSGHGERQKFHGGPDTRPAGVFVDREHQRRQLALIRDGGPVNHNGGGKRSFEGIGRIGWRPKGRDGKAEDTSDRCTEPPGRLVLAELFHLS